MQRIKRILKSRRSPILDIAILVLLIFISFNILQINILGITQLTLEYYISLIAQLVLLIILYFIAKKSINQFIKNQMHYDYLTLIGNRQKLEFDISRLFRAHKDFCLCYIDLDDFKGVNDRNGHLSGDMYLILFADSLKKLEDNNLMTYRVGGDEFVVVINDIPKSMYYIEKISIINGNKIELCNGRKEMISFSLGYTFSDEAYSLEKIIDIADKNMYIEKKK